MKPHVLAVALLLSGVFTSSALMIEFDLRQSNHGSAPGLRPENETIPGNSSGFGNEIGSGIWFDTESLRLSLSLGYGSSAGFSDLTGPAFAFLLHGPAPASETAPVLYDLASLHTFAADPATGGQIIGSLVLLPRDVPSLLDGLDYINIYTPANLGGEIRGQLVVATVPEPGSGVLLMTMGVGAMLLVFRRSEHRKARA